ncbi:MAG: hypothetical protein JSS02_17260, partial [Planctomycetes bacterium]|nr:hypothetical protein [Planctomycetota bacterium]
YVTGFSLGAMLAYRLAAELSGRIAAIAPVAGGLGVPVEQIERPVSVLHFHGTCDEFVPLAGGVGPRSISRTNFPPVEHSLRTWVKLNGCHEVPQVQRLSEPGADLMVTQTTYDGGREGAEVVFVCIEGGGHTWPGQTVALKLLGKVADNISANDLMWTFFQKHPRR